jgi:hypothetical protein
MIEVRTLYDLTETLPFDTYALDFYIGGRKLAFDYELQAGDKIVTTSKMLRHSPKTNKKTEVTETETDKSSKEIVANDENEAKKKNNSGGIAQNAFALDALIEVAKSAINIDNEEESGEVSSKPEVILIPDNIPEAAAKSEKIAEDEFWVTLNGRHIVLEAKSDNSPHEFVELMSYADLDLENPPPSKNMVITLNGKTVSFMDVISIGDEAVVKWAD